MIQYTTRYIRRQDIRPGMLIQFTYEKAKRRALVLNPTFDPRLLHSVDITLMENHTIYDVGLAALQFTPKEAYAVFADQVQTTYRTFNWKIMKQPFYRLLAGEELSDTRQVIRVGTSILIGVDTTSASKRVLLPSYHPILFEIALQLKNGIYHDGFVMDRNIQKFLTSISKNMRYKYPKSWEPPTESNILNIRTKILFESDSESHIRSKVLPLFATNTQLIREMIGTLKLDPDQLASRIEPVHRTRFDELLNSEISSTPEDLDVTGNIQDISNIQEFISLGFYSLHPEKRLIPAKNTELSELSRLVDLERTQYLKKMMLEKRSSVFFADYSQLEKIKHII